MITSLTRRVQPQGVLLHGVWYINADLAPLCGMNVDLARPNETGHVDVYFRGERVCAAHAAHLHGWTPRRGDAEAA